MKKISLFIIPISIFLFFGLAKNVEAATIYVSNYGDGTASKANFDLAYAAASTNDTILFPASGSATWSTEATISKAITINGNGTTLNQSGSLIYGFFRVTGFSSTDLVRITDFTFNGNRTAPQIQTDSVTLTSLRIDYNTFNLGNYAVTIGGAYGVIDNNTFYNCGGWGDFNAGSREQADASWATSSLVPGTDKFLFIENNRFIINGNYDDGNALDAEQGGKFVFRYNTFDYTAAPDSLDPQGTFSLHGSASGGCQNGSWQADEGNTKCSRRSPALVDIYNNRMVGKRIDAIVGFRGGSFLIHDNYHLDDYGGLSGIRLTEEEFRTDEDGQFTPTRSAWPGEDMINNTFIWNNIIDGVAQSDKNIAVLDFNYYCTGSGTPIVCCTGVRTGTCNDGEANAIITKNREYFLHAPEASGGKSTWVCKNGVTNCNGSTSSYPSNDTISYSQFTSGSAKPLPGQIIVGHSSGAHATVEITIPASEVWDGKTTGRIAFLANTQVGTFLAGESLDIQGGNQGVMNIVINPVLLTNYGNQTFSSSGANAYYPYIEYTCPHPLTGLTGSCDSTVAGTAGYNVSACTTPGDFTCNGYSISDLQTMISIILGTDSTTSRTQADMSTPPDGLVNISDLQLLIKKVLGIN